MNVDSFGPDHEADEPPDYGYESAPLVTHLTVADESDFPAGVVSDVIVTVATDDGEAHMLALDPQFASLLTICLLKRCHPDVFMEMEQRVKLGDGITIQPVSSLPPSTEGIEWARNRQERRHGKPPGQII